MFMTISFTLHVYVCIINKLFYTFHSLGKILWGEYLVIVLEIMESDTDPRVPHFGRKEKIITHATLLKRAREMPDLATTGTVRFILQLEHLGKKLEKCSGDSHLSDYFPPYLHDRTGVYMYLFI